ncbi:MAG: hypothetical protein A3B38_01010 [Candidatus Levybacteria bacterium RIFCSPLOWO2_01_FULL_36_13]|nr:MAG: hypothetical protein A2684_02250 [Candidatus Levybacteria bacterium RIFCSPHIGHO2_01_FULL_36_15b]OGH35466.1 MAG: hypothetical protein A3B38_01010 [Candidatus Levybacteria bacterium RIFCSPLOWO2_01_FULL_36_13]
MRDIFLRFYLSTKEPFNYLAAVFEIIFVVVALITWYTTNPFQLPTGFIYVATMIIFIFIVFKLKYIYNSLSYRSSLQILDYNIRKLEPNRIGSIINFDYDKIVPQTKILKFILKYYDKKAKSWAKDAYIEEVGIWFMNESNKIIINGTWTFYSPLKSMSISFESPNLKVLPYLKISQSQLAHNEPREQCKLFFENSDWRQALIIAFQKMESELIGKKFTVLVGTTAYEMWIQFMPKSAINRSFVFIFDNQKLHEGIHGVNQKLIKDFSTKNKLNQARNFSNI